MLFCSQILTQRRNNDIQREKRDNEDQSVQPPFQNNLIREDESYEVDEREVEDVEDLDIDQFDDGSSSHFLTRFDYQYAKIANYHESNNFEQVTCMPKIYQEIQHKSHGLISGIKKATQGKKNARNVPAKQGLPSEQKQVIQGSRDKFADT